MTEEIKDTTKGKQGFASNPHLINRGGRPKGSRNKSTLIKAQLKFDTASEEAAATLEAMMRNDKEYLGIKEDVPLSLRQSACKEILAKAIANEKDKDSTSNDKEEDKAEAQSVPLFSPVPVKTA